MCNFPLFLHLLTRQTSFIVTNMDVMFVRLQQIRSVLLVAEISVLSRLRDAAAVRSLVSGRESDLMCCSTKLLHYCIQVVRSCSKGTLCCRGSSSERMGSSLASTLILSLVTPLWSFVLAADGSSCIRVSQSIYINLWIGSAVVVLHATAHVKAVLTGVLDHWIADNVFTLRIPVHFTRRFVLCCSS